MEFFYHRGLVTAESHTIEGHACTHMRTRARNAHARARAHMRVIYILVVGVVVETV